jgi:succinate-semialdehyde dehydrogenase / glutarate-semialdehyde dehydrogenase
MYQNYGLFVDGGWRASSSGGTWSVLSPVSGKPLGECATATKADTEMALEAASRGLAAWSKTWGGRAEALHRIADEMTRRLPEAARVISTETGKPIGGLATDQFRWCAEEARRISRRIVESRAGRMLSPLALRSRTVRFSVTPKSPR